MTVDAVTLLPERTRGCCVSVRTRLPDDTAREMAEVHRALADPTRLQMLHMLTTATVPICVCDFTAAFALSQPTVSHHLARLRRAGFVTSTKHGVWSYHRIREDLSPTARAVLATVP